MPPSVLPLFHPRIGIWFSEKVGTPTDIQERAWPDIALGRHVLVTALTGCGKTLVYHGSRLVLVARRSVEIHAAPDDVHLPLYLAQVTGQLNRPFTRLK